VASVTRSSSSRRSARRKRIVEQLLQIVEEILAGGETYADVSVERLITEAGMSRSTFYVYFEDKGALLLALAEDVVQQLVVTAGEWWSLPHDVDRQTLEKTLQGIAATYLQHAPMWAALIDGAAYDPRVRESFRQVVDGSAKGLEQHIRAGQRAGAVRPDLDPPRTAAWLTWMTERGLYQLLPGASAAEVTKLVRSQTAIVWYTLYEGAPARSEPSAAA
jgi:AcrR family transcriptional regulator